MRFIQVLLLLCAFVLCSCSTHPDPKDIARPELPPETSFNPDAGRGNSLFVMLHLADGPELPFLLDTGSHTTVLDKSLEPKLGQRLRTEKITYGWLGKSTTGIYPAPALYFGHTRLLTGDEVWVDDVSRTSQPTNSRLMGILGMDCLRHYCLQLDFTDRKIRFLDPDSLDAKKLGRAFPLREKSGQFFVDQNLLGAKGERTLIDSADYNDGVVSAKTFKRELWRQENVSSRVGKYPDGTKMSEAIFPRGIFGGETYPNLLLEDTANSSDPAMNIIGLRFLARHLVTFNFPQRTMYLLRRTTGTPDDQYGAASNFATIDAAARFLSSLKKAGRLPDWPRTETGELTELPPEKPGETYPLSRTFKATRAGDAHIYYYTVIHPSADSPWKLQKAWRTDPTGQTVEEYPVIFR